MRRIAAKWRTSGVLLVLVASLSVAVPTTTQFSPTDAQRFLNDVKTLTQPKMEGRGDGTKGLIRAEHILVDRYKSLGLEPAGTNGYLQPFVVTTGAKLKRKNHFVVQSADAKKELKLNADYVPLSFSSSGGALSGLVFAGYGATAEEFGYDDYAGLDAKDKIVVVLRYEPSGFAAKSGNQGLTRHSQLVTKAINARNHGAKGLILVNGKLGEGEEDLLTKFGSVSGPENVGILFAQTKNAAADEWFRTAGKSLKDVQEQINAVTKPASFGFPEVIQANLAVDIKTTRATVYNVLAYLPGKTDEYVILGAHYDHLGRGTFDSLAPSLIGQIHPGADDNASGTAGVLELARVLAPLKGQLQRGILFMSFAGEELGLLGSAAWVKQPTKPLDKAVAMLNMDMIGRIKDNKVYVGGVGTGSTLQKVLDQARGDSPFKFEISQGGYSSSDHTSFVAKKIPVLFFFSGLHSDYHKPSDTWEKIDSNSAAGLLNIVARVTVELASEPEKPKFVEVVETNPHAGTPGGGGGYGAYFGSIPDFGQTENGVKFADIKPGSPAAKAGLKAGDVLIQFGDKPIKNLYDFTDALRRSKVGDVMLVTVLRDGKELKVDVKLEQRK
ncbi:MAG TPA: M28 family peptidase [Candidatus Limnocylindrales bacterium]|nr:M28 family peptidase [Candidatus Limnocylindrales bacterium]